MARRTRQTRLIKPSNYDYSTTNQFHKIGKKMMVEQNSLLPKRSKKNSKLFFKPNNCNKMIWKIKHEKILNLFNEASDSEFVTKNWNIINDQSNANYTVGNKTI